MSQSPPDHSDPASESPDDARIGRAFNRSLVLWVVIAFTAAVAVWWFNRPPPLGPTQETPLTAPSSPPKILTEIPKATFSDITAVSGIDFIHENGAYGDKLLPETM